MFLYFPAEERRSLHCDPAGRHLARNCIRYEVPVRHELRSPWPGGSQHPGQQQPGVQGVRLWHVPSAGGRPWGCIHHQGECVCVCVCVCVEASQWSVCASPYLSSLSAFINRPIFSITGREDPHPLDGPGGHRLQEVHLGQRRVELRHCDVGGDVIWRATILGHE